MYIYKCKCLFIPLLKAHFVKFDVYFCNCFPLISGTLPIWYKVCLTKVSQGLSTMSYLSQCLHNFLISVQKIEIFKQWWTITSSCSMVSSQFFFSAEKHFCSLFWANVGTSTMQPFFVVTNNKDESKTQFK